MNVSQAEGLANYLAHVFTGYRIAADGNKVIVKGAIEGSEAVLEHSRNAIAREAAEYASRNRFSHEDGLVFELKLEEVYVIGGAAGAEQYRGISSGGSWPPGKPASRSN